MRIGKIAYSLILLIAPGGIAAAQQVSFTVKLVNGHTGRAMANQHVVISLYDLNLGNPEGLYSTGTTDKDGLLVISPHSQESKLIYVEPGGYVVSCGKETPTVKGSPVVFPIADILSGGVSSSNRCWHHFSREKNIPGRLVIYIRDMNFWEKFWAPMKE